MRLFKTRDGSYWLVVAVDGVLSSEYGPFDTAAQAIDFGRQLSMP